MRTCCTKIVVHAMPLNTHGYIWTRVRPAQKPVPYPYPQSWVGVFTGMGMGTNSNTLGLPMPFTIHSLS
jgi:hypothetical protein